MVIEEERLDRLEARLHDAKALTPDLVTELISGACPRIAGLGASAQERVVRLTESGAHADAALTLIELELPQWKLRRLECDDGEWYCTCPSSLGCRSALTKRSRQLTGSCRLRL